VRILALDPGYAANGGCGVAIFDEGILRVADLVRPVRGTDILKTVRWTAVAVESWISANGGAEQLVAEWPQVYVASRSPGDPNDLLALAGICSAVAALGTWNVKSVTPREWKGTAPKDAMGKRVMGRLSSKEVGRICADVPDSLMHNVLDAVGIGLHHLGRLKRERVIPR
jgi:hypothetical protein